MALQKTSLAEQARDELLRRIVTGVIPAGSRLTEEALSAEFAISRTPVRDALSRLEADGMIERLPARGYQVCRLDVDGVDELLRCRMWVELMILERYFDNLPQEGLRELRDMLTAAGPEAPNALEIAREVDDRLHGLIGDACENRFFREFHNRLLCRRLPYRDFRNSPGATPVAELYQERLALLEALLSGDRGEAYRLLELHLELGRRDIQKVMKQ